MFNYFTITKVKNNRQNKLLKSIRLSVIFFLFLLTAALVFEYSNNLTQAETCSPAVVKVIARNSKGAFIPDINFSILNQLVDVDGKPKPGTIVATGKISALLGVGSVSFVPSTTSAYALKLWDKNISVGEFYFYNKIPSITCGSNQEVVVTLSGINFILRDSQQQLLKNVNFSLFTQILDANNKPIKDKLVSKFNTGDVGSVTTYVTDPTHTIDGIGNGSYVFVGTGVQGGMFEKYSMSVVNEVTTEVPYIFSDIAFTVKASSGVSYPSNTKIEVYKQAVDSKGEKILGTKIRNVITNDKGIAIFENPADIYVARILGSDFIYKYFWDIQMIDQQRKEVTLQTGADFTANQGACSEKSELAIVARNSQGEYIPGVTYELYIQSTDVNNTPIASSKVAGGKVESDGRGTVLFNPDSTKVYVLKIYDRSSSKGDFWFFDNIKFSCGENKEINKTLSSIKVILRNGDGQLLPNTAFSVYTQKLDIDNAPIAERSDLVGSLTTTAEGYATLYVSSDHKYDKKKKGVYVFYAKNPDGNGEYVEFNVNVLPELQTVIEYKFSDVLLYIDNALGESIVNNSVIIYEQVVDSKGGLVLSTSIFNKLKTSATGAVSFNAPPGTYVAVVKDLVNKDIIFWNIKVDKNQRLEKTVITPYVRVTVRNSSDMVLPTKTPVHIYNLVKDAKDGYYYRQSKIATVSTAENGYAGALLSPGAYLFTAKIENIEYIKSVYVNDGKLSDLLIKKSSASSLTSNSKFSFDGVIETQSVNKPSSLLNRVSGYILLQVESRGEAWYVNPDSRLRYYLKDGAVAYQALRQFGLGITNTDLAKIPAGHESRFQMTDSDADGLPDKLEEGLGTDPEDSDSDGDGYTDGTEVLSGYNPLGAGKPTVDTSMVNRLKGKILLQVEARGQAWYINPVDGKRYYMADGEAAYQIMRYLSLGITNSDLSQITEDSL